MDDEGKHQTPRHREIDVLAPQARGFDNVLVGMKKARRGLVESRPRFYVGHALKQAGERMIGNFNYRKRGPAD